MKRFTTLLIILLAAFFNPYIYSQTRGLYVTDDDGGVAPPPQEKRYALIIGNKDYEFVAKLRNPSNDVDLMNSTLKALGFEVISLKNVTLSQMNVAIKNLGRKAKGQNAVALFYYSGHGLQVNNDNWLVPIDAEAQSPADVQAACVSLNLVMDQLQQANTGTNIIILDACRNNPFPYSKSTGGGLATPKNTPSGTYIAFSTAPLTTALDGFNNNSPYTEALVEAMQIPNIKIEDMFKRVRVKIKNLGQTPWENSSLEGDFYFNPKSKSKNPVTPTGKQDYIELGSGVGFSMKYITKGSFVMGNDDGESHVSEKPLHTVFLNDLYIGKYEVTFDEFDKFCESTGRTKPDDAGWGRGKRPVVHVSWNDAVAYCEWLSHKTGKKYRLPTEAEWEYVAKAGGNQRFSGSNDIYEIGWFGDNSGKKTHIVGQKPPNSWGVYDMSGNVWEWCGDWFGVYSSNVLTNPQGASNGTDRILRGGCCMHPSSFSRNTTRYANKPTLINNDVGFRIVCATN